MSVYMNRKSGDGCEPPFCCDPFLVFSFIWPKSTSSKIFLVAGIV